MDKIGVRELRQHASRYLARVATGESLEVTDRGRPVALLVPVPRDRWQELLASGDVIPPAMRATFWTRRRVTTGSTHRATGCHAGARALRIYLDSSAIVKLVQKDVESEALRRYLRRHPSDERVTSVLSRLEVLRAVVAGGESAVAKARRL